MDATSDPMPAWRLALLLAPVLLPALAAATFGRDPARGWRRAQAGTLAALAAALAGAAAVALDGRAVQGLWRADAVGAVVGVLVAFIGWVIVRYSAPYLAGDRRQPGYARALLLALAAVAVVVVSNHLGLLAAAWAATSLALHRLLTHHAERPAARIAAHKKFVTSRVADAALVAALVLLYGAFGTLQIDALAAQATNGLPAAAQAAMLLVVVAALLKCAQLPAHGWLIQVMEAPTPVSALLHAGVVNLGGFVLIRLSPLLAEAPAAQALAVVVGAVTAAVAALVMMTRISVKVSLAWSTCAQMGFMLMQCGLGLPEMALVHLVAHSLYKAHAFLSAGGAVAQATLQQLTPAQPAPGVVRTVAAAGAGAAVVGALAAVLAPAAPPALWAMAVVVSLALAPLLAAGRPWVAMPVSAMLSCAYFLLHAAAAALVPAPPPVPVALVVAVLLLFTALFGLQTLIRSQPQGRLARRLYPWCYAGLFLDEAFTRVAFRLWPLRGATPGRSA